MNKNLYHGTILEYSKSINKNGLIPKVGNIVATSYGEHTVPLVFFADINKIDTVIGIIKQIIYLKLGSELNLYSRREVTPDMIKKYGVIYVVKQNAGILKREGKNDISHPQSVEKNDYYSRVAQKPIKEIKGKQLIEFINKNTPESLAVILEKRSVFGRF